MRQIIDWIPIWLAVLLGVAGAIGAIGVIWTKIVKPGAKLITTTETMIPILVEWTKVFGDSPQAFTTLKEIAAQFHTDSGTTLRDVINRLEEAARVSAVAAEQNRVSSEALRVEAQSAKELAGLDRTQMLRLMMQIDRLSVKFDLDKEDASLKRGEIATTTSQILDDMTAAHQRASDAENTGSGSIADASVLVQPKTELNKSGD